MKKILISDKLADDGINYLNAQDGIKVHIQTGLDEDGLCEVIGEYDGLLIRSDTKVTSKVLQAASSLKVVGRAGIGVDNIDIEAATERGIIVMNTPNANATTTAELAIAHIFSLSRNLPNASKSVRGGKWERAKLVGSEVNHKTLAVIGFGTIGRLVATRAAGLGMRVIAFDPFVTEEIFSQCSAKSVDLQTALQEADYLTLHCPLMEKTRHIIDDNALKTMKKTAMLINCARGGLVDEEALFCALQNGDIAKAALDVYANEPPTNSPLFGLDNIEFTPHLGASTREAQVAVSVEIAIQAVTYLQTGVAINALNLSCKTSAEELQKARQFMQLAEVMGKLLQGLTDVAIEKLEVALFGEVAQLATAPISTQALVGILTDQFSTPVNNVNADNIAKKQGITLLESKCERTQGYLSLIRLTGFCAGKEISVAGTLLGAQHPRIVGINQFEIEVVPEGYLLITGHNDKPGVISRISAILGESNINISRMQVGVPDSNEQAMAVISISSNLPDELLEKIRELSFVNSAILAKL